MNAAAEDPKAGDRFVTHLPVGFPLGKFREDFKRKTGFALHIEYKVGPVTRTDGKIHFPVTPIDDDVVTERYGGALPKMGYCVYVGRLVEPE